MIHKTYLPLNKSDYSLWRDYYIKPKIKKVYCKFFKIGKISFMVKFPIPKRFQKC